MKNITAFFLIMLTIKCYSQDTVVYKPTHTQIFSLSPMSKKVNKVNGLVFGVGYFDNTFITKQTVNGVNLEANPIGLFAPFLFLLATDDKRNIFLTDCTDQEKIIVNGLNISSCGFLIDAKMNGLNLSVVTRMNSVNGMSISLLSGVGVLNGLQMGLWNDAAMIHGAQIGLYNHCDAALGFQFGIINISNKTKGLQIGLLNINKKRALPFINF